MRDSLLHQVKMEIIFHSDLIGRIQGETLEVGEEEGVNHPPELAIHRGEWKEPFKIAEKKYQHRGVINIPIGGGGGGHAYPTPAAHPQGKNGRGAENKRKKET